MKFNDGFWLLKHGVKAFYGLQVTNITEIDESLDLQVATRPIRHRGDTLGGPLLSVQIHSPANNIIGVKIQHFEGRESNPSVQLFPTGQIPLFAPQISKTGDTHTLRSGSVEAVITRNPYTIQFRNDNTLLTEAGVKHQSLFEVPYKWTINSAPNSSCLANDLSSHPHPRSPPEFVRYINSELTISPGELFYGFGEQFGPYIKNGQNIAVWNRDGGTSTDQAYKCVPFYMSNKGYGIFINNFGIVDVEVGSEKVSRVGFSVPDESLEFFFVYGQSPLDVLSNYTLLTGRPALPPTWTFGLWLSTSFLTDYSSKTVSEFLTGMQERRCNVKVFHLDCFWMAQYQWCSFTFDPDNFPDPKAYLSEIKSKFGVKICVWINPYFSQYSPIFKEGVREGYFIKRTDGLVWQWDLWQPGLAILDITNPEAKRWYTSKLNYLLDLGVDAFKTDFGERIPHVEVVYADGSDPYRMHNAFSVMYNELVFGLLEARFGKDEAVVFARSSAAGGQRFPVHWGGDCESTFEAMAETIRGCLSLTTSGFAFASHDIGGFEGIPPAEIYIRWLAFGLFSSHSRLHGSSSYRVPWEYGEDAPKILAKLLNMKHRLMPYLYNYAIQAKVKGHPMQRAMWLEHWADRTTHYLEQQFMLGPSLLVAPVFVPAVEKSEYYIPEGKWTSLWDQTVTRAGPTWVKEVIAISDIPVWVRPGSIIAFGPDNVGRPDYPLDKELEIGIYEIAPGQTLEADIPSGHSSDLAGRIIAKRLAKQLTIQWTGHSLNITSIFLVGNDLEVKDISGGEIGDTTGLRFTTQEGTKEIILYLT